MVNAVYSEPISLAQPASPSVQDLAAAGHFRSIALWLNEPLAPQGIYIQVQTDQPGCLRLLVEFDQAPIKERLTRFLCHRVWLLNSPLIEGIHVIARPAGRRRVLWQQRIRIVTPALRERQQQQGPGAVPHGGSPLPPRLRVVASSGTGSAATARTKVAMGTHLKTFRAFVLTGSAVAAFVFGCLMEVILTGPSPVLPTFASSHPELQKTAGSDRVAELAADQGANPSGPTEVIPVRYEVPGPESTGGDPQMRSPIVDAAKEPVAVIQQQTPSLSPLDDVTLLFGGDISLEDVSYDETGEAEQLFAGLPDYQQADLAMVNLNSSLAAAATSLEEELYHRSRPDAIDVLKKGGVDIVNLTNEGTMEFGGEGLAETLETLDRGGLYRVGAGRNELEARRPEIIDIKGKRIAYLSYAQGGDSAAHGERPGVNAQGLLSIAEDIRALRDEVDWIVVNYRWQTDIPGVPADWQTNLARLAVDQGADLVVGYHPETLQGAEIYKGRPIVYSLGDFVFQKSSMDPDASEEAAAEPPLTQDTAVLKVDLRDNQMKVELVPVKLKGSQPEVATGRQGTEILQKLEQASAGFEQPMNASVILELKGKAPTAEQPTNPDAPFVTPESTQAQPLEPLIDQNFTEQKRQIQPENLLVPTEAEAPEAAPALEEGLEDWGPKGTLQESEFTPIPQSDPGMMPAQELDRSQPMPFQGDGPISPTLFDGDESNPSSSDDSDDPYSGDGYSTLEGDYTNPEALLQPPTDSTPVADPGEAELSEGAPTIDGPALAPELTPKPEAAKPFGEPLVGPLGAVETPGAVAAVEPPPQPAPEAMPGTQAAKHLLPVASLDAAAAAQTETTAGSASKDQPPSTQPEAP